MKFGDRLKSLRKEKGLTQSELAKIFSLGESTISFYESNKRTPDYELLARIASFFNVSIDFILGVSDSKNPPNQDIEHDFSQEELEILEKLKKHPEIIEILNNPKYNSDKTLKQMLKVWEFVTLNFEDD